MENRLNVKRLVVGDLSANCFIAGGEPGSEGMVVDPGGDKESIFLAIEESGLDIRIIVLTHGHSDHIAALYEVQARTGAAVAIHAEDAGVLEGPEAIGSQFGISYKNCPADRLLHEADVITVNATSFTVIHTPGHTPGSICLYTEGRIFTGDTLFHGGIGTTLMPGSSRPQLLNSIRTRLMNLPDETVIYPGHGRETTIGTERRENPYVNGRRDSSYR